MCKKRIIVMVVAVVLILCAACIPAFADGTYKWSQSADHSSANATYSGRVNWLDEGVAPNYVTYYARISGKDSFLFTDSNAGASVSTTLTSTSFVVSLLNASFTVTFTL